MPYKVKYKLAMRQTPGFDDPYSVCHAIWPHKLQQAIKPVLTFDGRCCVCHVKDFHTKHNEYC